jgi:RNA polymerase sigma factor (sigma-70 family)
MPTTAHAADVGRWYERYASSLRFVAARVTNDPDDADDALHETFLAAWRARERFDAARDPLPWLLTITRRKALTIVSSRVRRRVSLLSATPAASAEDEAVLRESEELVRRVVRLEPALALHALAGLPARLVGERLGVPMRTAASRIARGRRRVREFVPPATHPSSARSKAPWSISS